MSDIDTMPTEELDRLIAEHVGDDGFEPAEECDNGHANRDHLGIGTRCPMCRFEWSNRYARGARIGRGKPKSFSDSLDLIWPVAVKWASKKSVVDLCIGGFSVIAEFDSDERSEWSSFCELHDDGTAARAAEALARALVTVLGKEAKADE